VDVDLITPIWSSARSGHQEEFGNMTKKQEDGLLGLISDGGFMPNSSMNWIIV